MERTSVKVNFTEVYRHAVETKADMWVAACGGNEQPFSHGGVTWLYVYNPATDEHGYLNMGTDIVQPDAPWAK